MKRTDENHTTLKSETYLRNTVNKFLQHKMALAGLITLLLLILSITLIPYIFPLDPKTSDVFAMSGIAPNPAHPLGTDVVGRDILARLVYGGRVSLMIGLFSSLIGLLIGVPLGLMAGYYRGWIENAVMRVADVFMSFPSMIFILVLVAVVGTSIWSVIAVIGILGWPQFARLISAKVMSIRETEYVESARAIGTKDINIIMKYVLPNALAPILIQFTFRTAQAIIMESSLSFLGMGIQPPTASWGNMMFYAQSITVLSRKPWIWVPAGICLVLTVMSINSMGDGIRDAMDPKTKV